MRPTDKTNVMRVLDSRGIAYGVHTYEPDATLTGAQIAALLGEPADHVFKTLVTQGKSNKYYVFVVPVEAELDLKKAARAAGEKSVAMIRQKDLLPLTGYVHGGCSPVGMKKAFPTSMRRPPPCRACTSAPAASARRSTWRRRTWPASSPVPSRIWSERSIP